MTEFDLAQFEAAVHARTPGWERAGIRWQFSRGPERDKSAAWVACEAGDHISELIVWTSGEAEFAVADLATGEVHEVHHDLAHPAELTPLLDQLTQQLIE